MKGGEKLQTIKERISANITKYRKRESLSQKDLAEKLQTKPSTVSSWEQSVSTPNADMIVEMCNLFHISVDEMYGVSLANAKKSIEYEAKFLNYLLTLGYEYIPTLDMDIIGDGSDRGIYIKDEDITIPLTKEEFQNLENDIMRDIETEIYRLRKQKNL